MRLKNGSFWLPIVSDTAALICQANGLHAFAWWSPHIGSIRLVVTHRGRMKTRNIENCCRHRASDTELFIGEEPFPQARHFPGRAPTRLRFKSKSFDSPDKSRINNRVELAFGLVWTNIISWYRLFKCAFSSWKKIKLSLLLSLSLSRSLWIAQFQTIYFNKLA